MIKNVLLSFGIFLLLSFSVEGILRWKGLQPAHSKESAHAILFKPDSFCVKDDVLGWRLGTGEFETYQNRTLIYKSRTNGLHNRVTSLNPSSTTFDSSKTIFLYGCSFTFGQSVPDSSNYPFYLQSLLPEYSVQNKAVPAYGLVQMYLSLKQDVEDGRKPDIAVINYAGFQDERTALGLNWTRRFRYGIEKNTAGKMFAINYPYGRLAKKDSLVIDYCAWANWPKDFPLRNRSAFVNLLNTRYDQWSDEHNKKAFSRVSLLCCNRIMEYCAQHNIKLLFYGLDEDAKPILDSLSGRKAVARLSSVHVIDEGFNCAPLDALHPSAKAHKIYASEVLDCLLAKGWVAR